ncbi:MAG: hypothetical protein Q8O30_09555 [Candidatus Omnitrophota bacterium]|nr:hypothetical protein [Candidatus Omnitrophota bacterium]
MKITIIILLSFISAFLFLVNLPFFALATIILPFLFIILSRKMEYGLYIAAIWVPLQYFLTQYYIGIFPQNFVWIDEIVITLLFLITFSNAIFKGVKLKFSSIDIIVFIFIVHSVISAIINLVNPLIALLGIRSFLQYYLLYFAVKNSNIEIKTYKSLVKIIIITFIIQIPVSIFQFLTWRPVYINPLTGGYVNKWDLSYYDAVVGTFGRGAANNFGYLLTMSIFVLFGAYQILKQKKYLLFTLLLIIPLILTQSRGSYLVFIAVFFYTFKTVLFKNIGKTVVILTLLLIVFSVSFYLYFQYSGYKFQELFNIKNIMQEQMEISPGASGRIVGIKIANNILFNQTPSFLIGVGPGMFSSSAGVNLNSPLYISTIKKLNSNRCITETDIVPMMTEFGYLGLIIFIFLVIAMIRKNMNIYRITNNKYLKAVCFGGKGVLLIFLIGALLVKIWEVQYIAFYVWLYMGCVENYNASLKEGRVNVS